MERRFEKKEILTIVVNYNTDNEVVKFVKDIIKQQGLHEQIVIILDNSAHFNIQNNLNIIPSNMKVFVYTPSKNLGYLGAASWGLQEYLKDYPLPEWIVVSNSDIEFQELDFFKKLSEYYKTDSPAVIAPDIELQTNSITPSSSIHQNPYMIKRPSRRRMRLMKCIFNFYYLYLGYAIVSGFRYYLKNWYLRLKNDDIQPLSAFPVEIYAPFGAFIIFHRNYFERGGNLKYGSFLFGEEIFVAEQLRKLKLKAVFDGRLKVLHKEHSSLINLNSRHKFFYVKESLKYLLDTFFS